MEDHSSSPAAVEAKLRERFNYQLRTYPGADPLHLAAADALAAQAAALTSAASRIEELERAMGDIAEGLVPPIPHGHYLAHRHAVNVARVALRQALPDKG